MGNFQDNARGSGFQGGNRRPFKKKTWGNDRQVTMHKTVCSECGKECEVPFRPTGEKPVYCNTCFSSKRNDGNDRGHRPDFGNRGPRRQFGDRPNYGSNSRSDFKQAPANDDTKKQLLDISGKLNRILAVLEKLTEANQEDIKSKKEEKKQASKISVKRSVAKSKSKKK